MLPFPDLVKGAGTDKRRISRATADIYFQLEAQGLLPIQFQGAASALIEEMEEITGRK